MDFEELMRSMFKFTNPSFDLKERRIFFMANDWLYTKGEKVLADNQIDLTSPIRDQLEEVNLLSEKVYDAIVDANVNFLSISHGVEAKDVIKLFQRALVKKSFPFLRIGFSDSSFELVELIDYLSQNKLEIGLEITSSQMFDHPYMYRHTIVLLSVYEEDFEKFEWSRFSSLNCLFLGVTDPAQVCLFLSSCGSFSVKELNINFNKPRPGSISQWLKENLIEEMVDQAFRSLSSLRRVAVSLPGVKYDKKESNNARYLETVVNNPISEDKILGILYDTKITSLQEECLRVIKEKNLDTSILPAFYQKLF